MNHLIKAHYFGLIGILIGLLAVSFATFQADIREMTKHPVKIEKSLSTLAMEAGKSLIRTKILGEQKVDNNNNQPIDKPHDLIQIIYMLLGLVAFSFGVVSWIKKEHIRLSGAAVSLGIIAIAWQYVLFAIVIAIIILILSNLS